MTPRFEHLAAALVALAILVAIGAFGIWTGYPWLVPSLGSATLLPTMSPQVPTARAWNTCVGQLVALVGGFAGVFAVGAETVPAYDASHSLAWARIAAVAIAVGITVLLQVITASENPAGGATALLVALGTLSASWQSAFILVIGILLVSILAEGARFVILRLRRRTGHSG